MSTGADRPAASGPGEDHDPSATCAAAHEPVVVGAGVGARATSGAVPSCHADGDGPPAPPGAPVLALVGAPNSGKSTLFNALTGRHRTVGNWPGTTVEVGRSAWAVDGQVCELLDLPGAYGLDAHSPDEEFTRDLLRDDPPALTVVVVGAAQLAQSLYLLAELRERRQRVLVALTMLDIAARRGVEVDAQALAAQVGVPVIALDPRRGQGRVELAQAVARTLAQPVPQARCEQVPEDSFEAAEERMAWVDAACRAAAPAADTQPTTTVTDRVDRWLTAPLVGPVVFLAVMWAVFQLTTTVAAPLQDLVGAFLSGPVTSAAAAGVGAVGLADSWVEMLVVDGLISGVGMLLTFAPLVAIMFALLALLEDSGYMARAAVVTDRLMRAIGLPGQAFLPMIVGFGCNVPAVSATRILPDARHRLAAAMLVPFTSCSARLTVYVLLAATFFPGHAGTAVFAMYLASIAIIVLVGLVFRATLLRAVGDEPAILLLPPYQRPTLRLTLSITWLRLKGFLATAGGIIVVTVTLVWLLQAIPIQGGAGFGHVDPEDSLFAGLARVIAPVFTPLGFGDWHTVGALVVGFVAKEAVLTSWAQTYAAGDPTAGQSPDQLQAHIATAFESTSGGATTAAVIAFMVFLLIYTPCVATLAAQAREIGRRWTAFSVAVNLVLAWSLALVIFQIGRVLG